MHAINSINFKRTTVRLVMYLKHKNICQKHELLSKCTFARRRKEKIAIELSYLEVNNDMNRWIRIGTGLRILC